MADAAVRSKKPATSKRTPAGGAPTAPHTAAEASDARIDIAAVTDMLLGTWADTRREAREMLKDPAFHRVEGLGMAEHRERVLSQLHLLVENGGMHRAFPKEYGGQDDNGANIAGFEELVSADPSLQIKSGVQWGLFGSAVLQLGTKEHHDKWLPGIMSLEIPGAFAMTETGHGSDVAAIGTTATYDPETEEFVIHTPFRGAWKDYLGNAALHGIAATVFAQLITNGVNHGVHCFYVPLRDEHGEFLPGIGGEDDGLKGGLNGIDNGRLHFDHVRVPRTNLLNKYGDVASDGTYSSHISSPGRRFFTMLGTLVQGRVSLDGAASWASALGLDIAITYANQRRQFDSGTGTDEVVLLDYGKHQRRLLTRLATTYASIFAHDEFLQEVRRRVQRQGRLRCRSRRPRDSRRGPEAAVDLARARHPAGGTRGLRWSGLPRREPPRRPPRRPRHLRHVRGRQQRAAAARRQATAERLRQAVQGCGCREARLVRRHRDRGQGVPRRRAAPARPGGRRPRARRLGRSSADCAPTSSMTCSPDAFSAWWPTSRRGCARHPVSHLSEPPHCSTRIRPSSSRRRGHTRELLQWEAFTDAVNRTTDEGTKHVLTWLRDLFGLGLIEKHLSWHLINGRLSMQRAGAVSSYIDRLCARLRPHAQDLVDAFGYEPEHVRASISSGAERERQDEARAYYAALAESGDAPISEKVANKK